MLSQIANLQTAANGALATYVAAGCCASANVKEVIDKDLSDNQQAALLQGSIIQVEKEGTTTFYAVPADARFKSNSSSGPMLTLQEKWGGPTSDKKLDKLGTIKSVLLGVITYPSAGSDVDPRAQHTFKTLPAMILQGTPGASIDSVALLIANSTKPKTLGEAVLALGLEWMPWGGVLGGLESFPVGDGLPNGEQLAVKLTSQYLLESIETTGTKPMAEVTLKAIGLLADDGTASAIDVGAFLTALADMPQAMYLMAAGLAVQDRETEPGKEATRLGDQTRGQLAEVAVNIDVRMASVVREQIAGLTALGMDAGGGQIGMALALEVKRVVAALAKAAGDNMTADRARGATGGAGAGGGGIGDFCGAGIGGSSAGGAGNAGGSGGAGPTVLSTQEQLVADLAQAKATLEKLNLSDDFMATFAVNVEKAQADVASRGIVGSPLQVLVPDLCLNVAAGEVLKLIAHAVGASPTDIAAELALTLGLKPQPQSIFSASDEASVNATVSDWGTILSRSGMTFDSQPADWRAAAERVHIVQNAYRRAVQLDGAAQPMTTETVATKSTSNDDDNRLGLFKTTQAAGKDNKAQAVAGEMITVLGSPHFARQQYVADKGDTALEEVRRLCSLPGEIGEACRAYIYSNGFVSGPAPKGISAVVVDARAWLLSTVQDEAEAVVTPKRVPEVLDKLEALSSAVLCVRSVNKDGKLEETTSLYCLSVYLLGGTPPADEHGTDNDAIGQGTWGTRVGVQSTVDIPAAMFHLARLLAMAHGCAGGGPYHGAPTAVRRSLAHQLDGLGLVSVARHATGTLNPEKVDEAFKDLFQRAQNLMVRIRSRRGSPPIDWPTLISEVHQRKISPLLQEQRAEAAVERRTAQLTANRSKSPRRDDGDNEEEKGKMKKGKKGGEPNEFVQKKKLQKEEAKEKKAAAALAAGNAPANAASAAALLATPVAAGAGGVPSLAPGSISCLASKEKHNGVVEALAALYVARNPERRQRELQPCPFVAVRKGPAADSSEVCNAGVTAGACAQCDGWKATPVAQRVPFLPAEVAAVKAACTAKVQACFA